MNKSKTETNETIRTAPDYVNRVTLVGYLGGAPEPHNNCVVLSLATKRSWLVGKDWKSETEWHRIVAWGKLAEAVKPLAKGDHVQIEGDLRSSERDDLYRLHDGAYTVVKARYWDIRADSIRKIAKLQPAA